MTHHRLPALTTAALLVTTGLVALAAPAQATAVGHPRTTLAAGNTYSVVIGSDGRPYGAGANAEHQLTGNEPGDEVRSMLTPMTGLPAGATATSVAAAQDHTLVLGSNGVAYGTGHNGSGQLGAAPPFRVTLTPIPLPGGVASMAVAAGGYGHSLLVGANGTAYGLGVNADGQITGVGDRSVPAPLTGLPGGVAATAAAAGLSHSLVLGSDGTVYGTGRNHVGQLTGVGDRTTLTAMPLPGAVAATAIAAGQHHSLAIGVDGVAYGTGANGSGQLTGAGDRTAWQAMALPPGVTARGIAAGSAHSLVLGSDGVAYGAGSNTFDQLTSASSKPTTTVLTPISASIDSPIVEVAGDAGSHATLLRDGDGVVHGVGHNADQQLTTAVAGATAPSPTALAGQPLTPVVGPAFATTPRVGAPARVRGTWSPTPTAFTYQWLVGGAAVAGATGSTYTPRARDLGKALRVRVTPVRSGFTASPVVVSAKVARGAAPKRISRKRIQIIGGKEVGALLRPRGARAQDFSPRPTRMRYQWLLGKKRIPGATKKRYRVRPADRGGVLRVRVRTQRVGHTASSHLSKGMRIARR